MLRLCKINPRILLVLAAIGLPFVWYGYVLAEQLIYHGIKVHNGWTEVDLKTLGYFYFDPAKDGIDKVPERFRALDGKRVVLKGMMFDGYSAARNVNQFELVYNIQQCCLGGPPQVQERVFARCGYGKSVRFYNSAVDLTGTLHVKLERDPEFGIVTAVYELDVESVDPQ